ncbi:MAG: Type IV pilus biogenesis protein PilZ [uncultured Thiotrichaceae bacterium]|uniref:Type IV pilus biogenesis protein PilZ n=1 Tax=uncultured Thiotrichaceae bacterium TaxID=298394 RepID=A0A6S6SSL7_9GAMM|nr:MAG: Type IV pilus biogenesis protein PilZ [uncultured Thiotrichaceae bacterium]
MESQKLSLVLADRDKLHNHYLPMLSGGGIFVPTNNDLPFGTAVLVQVDLLSEKQKAVVPGRVVWITPVGAQRSLMKGVGIQITGSNKSRIQQYFENLIADRLYQAPTFPCY